MKEDRYDLYFNRDLIAENMTIKTASILIVAMEMECVKEYGHSMLPGNEYKIIVRED